MAGRPRVLTGRQRNRALLARQLLLRRARMPVARAVERVGGIQNQYAPNGYIRLWSMLEGFRRPDLTRALERRNVVQATLMRSTIHLVSAGDFWPMAAGIREAQRRWWLRTDRGGTTSAEVASLAEEIDHLLADGPLRQQDLAAVAGSRLGLVGAWIELVRVPPSGTWEQRRAGLYQTAARWLGPDDAEPGVGIERVVRRYLAGFGPATPASIAGWAGVPVADIVPVLERLPLRRFLDEEGGDLVDVPRAPLPDGDTPAPVRFLPTWDATLLVHARPTRILPERFRPLVFNTRTPHSFPTFLVDGAVAGTWRLEGERVALSPFEPLSRSARSEAEEEAARLAAFHA